MTQYLRAGGQVMYEATTSPNVTVSFDLSVSPQATIDIGNASVTPQVIFDEFEVALLTADGMAWHAQQGTIVTHDDLPGVGPILFMQDNIRLRREASGDVNAAVGGYVLSTQGTPVDGANGGVGFVGGLSIDDIVAQIERDGGLAKTSNQVLLNRTETNPTTGVMTVYADDDTATLLTADVFEDVAATQDYRGQGADRRNRLTTP